MSMMKPSLSMMDLSNMARISSETPGIRSVTRTNPSSTMDTSSVLSGGSVNPPRGSSLSVSCQVDVSGEKTGYQFCGAQKVMCQNASRSDCV